MEPFNVDHTLSLSKRDLALFHERERCGDVNIQPPHEARFTALCKAGIVWSIPLYHIVF